MTGATEKVWVSDCFLDASIISKFNLNPDDEGKDYWKDTEFREELDRLDKLMRKHEAGGTLTEAERPTRAHPRYRELRFRSCLISFASMHSSSCPPISRRSSAASILEGVACRRSSSTRATEPNWYRVIGIF